MLALKDLEHLSARLHGRRARLAEGPRLAALCGLGSPAALASALLPGAAAGRDWPLRELVPAFVREARWTAACLGGRWGDYAGLQAERFRLMNVRTALRGLAAGAAAGEIAAALIPLPAGEGCGPELASAGSARALPDLLPPGRLRDGLAAAVRGGRDVFLAEASLERGLLAEQVSVSSSLGGADGELASGLAAQESAAFNLSVAARGRFFHSYGAAELLPLYAPGPAMGPRRYSRLLAAGTAAELRSLAAGSAVEAGPPEPDLPALEALAWRRLHKLAVRAFTAAAGGSGTAAAYLALRRVELANLASVAEGLRLGLEPGALLRRLIPRAEASGD